VTRFVKIQLENLVEFVQKLVTLLRGARAHTELTGSIILFDFLTFSLGDFFDSGMTQQRKIFGGGGRLDDEGGELSKLVC
jgi:hypothetical protein